MTTPRTSPDQESTGWPKGIPYIVGNEACERFSYYGMRAILYVYMAEELYRRHPRYAAHAEDVATVHYHLFSAGVYAFGIAGAVLADRFFGKYRTILWLSLVYCAGHAVLSGGEGSLWGLWLGLGLIAVGSGGIKPCVSAHVGDQFGKGSWFRLRTVYQIFYFTINLGAAASMLLIPWIFALRKTETGLLREYAVSIAFAVPGLLMLVATLAFFMGRKVFVHVPAAPGGRLGLLDAAISFLLLMSLGHLVFTSGGSLGLIFGLTGVFLLLGFGLFAVRQRIQPDDGFLAVILHAARAWLTGGGRDASPALPEDDDLAQSRFLRPAVAHFGAETTRGPHAVLKIMSIFVLVTVFWSLFDQSGSSWIRQAQMMRTVKVLGIEVLPEQLQALNPVMVMLLIPFVNYVLFPAVERLGYRATALRRMTAGMLLASLSFVAVAWIQHAIDREGPGQVSILWQAVPYFIITLAEVLVSITGLEFAYSQAPKRMKSTIMGFWLFTVALGNLLVSVLASAFTELGKSGLTQFFWLFAGLMLVSGGLFGLRAYFYVERDYVQE